MTSSIFQFPSTDLQELYSNPGLISQLTVGLSERRYYLSNLGIDRNTFAYWNKMGLVPYAKKGQGWRSFSFYECVWLKTILDFRDMGAGVEKIKTVQQKLWGGDAISFQNQLVSSLQAQGTDAPDGLLERLIEAGAEGEEEVKSQFEAYLLSYFSIAVLYAIVRKEGCAIRLDKGGDIIIMPLGPALRDSAAALQQGLFTESYVLINIYPLIRELCLLEEVVLPPQLSAYIATPSEQALLREIRTGRYEEIIINVNEEGKPTHLKLIDGRITRKVLKALQPFLHKGQYQDLQFKVRGGKLITYSDMKFVKL